MTRWLPGFLILAVLAASPSAGQEALPKAADVFLPGSGWRRPDLRGSSADDPNGKPNGSREDWLTSPAEGKVWISPEELKTVEERYQKLREAFIALQQQLKKEKHPPSACKLSGRLEGDVALLRAEIHFDTWTPQSTIFLGLKNGYLVDEGRIDDGVPHLESTVDDGYFVRVEKAGPHHVTLDIRVPVVAKRSITAAAGNERGFDLGLPGAAVTTFSFAMPPTATDLRWNDNALAPKSPGQWDVTVGAQKSLAIVWKEAIAAPSALAGASARANLKVKLEDGRIEIAGDLVLEDAKNPVREWQVLLPAQAKVSPAAGSPAFTWTPPEGGSNVHIIRPIEPSEKITLALQAQYTRTLPQQKLPVGPVLVQGTLTHGTILIQSAPGALRAQGPIFHKFGQTFPRDPPKALAGVENIAQFQFWNAPFSGKALSPAKAPLEIEWKAEKGQVDAAVEHDVKLRENHGQRLVDVESKFAVKAANFRVESLDLQAPAVSFPELLWLGVQPSGGFPAALRWPVALAPRPAFPLSLAVLDEGVLVELPPADAQGRVRLNLHRPIIGQEMIVKAQSRLFGPGDVNRLRVELPKLFGVLDRGAKVTIWAPPGQELLVGPPNQREPVQEKFEQTFEQMPSVVELSWRAAQRERLARTVVDLMVREHAIHVRQTLLLPAAAWSGGATQTGQLALRLPAPGFAFSSLSAPRLGQEKALAWIKLPAATKELYEVQLEYDIARGDAKNEGGTSVPLLWPDGATSREAKLRLWAEPGITPALEGLGGHWKERPLEEGSNAKTWPALVAAGIGPNLPVTILTESAKRNGLPAFVAERSLIQVRIEEDGSQFYRCRFWVRKFSAPWLDVDLPSAWEQAGAHVRIDGKEVVGVKSIDPFVNRMRIPLAPHLYPQPVSFEIVYQAPAANVEGKRLWQISLVPPRFDGDVAFGRTRWHVALPFNETAFLLGPATVDYQWGLRGWQLYPEPSVSPAELDAWIHSPEAGDDPAPGLTWWRTTVERQRLYHVPRQIWLVLCSGAMLAMGMVVLLAPLSRFALVLIIAALSLGIAGLGLFHAYLLPVLLMGCQPGLAVLALAAALQWIVQERSRRQLIYMPTFSRAPQSSSIVRSQNKPLDPSTIDAPAKGPGSVKSTGH